MSGNCTRLANYVLLVKDQQVSARKEQSEHLMQAVLREAFEEG